MSVLGVVIATDIDAYGEDNTKLNVYIKYKVLGNDFGDLGGNENNIVIYGLPVNSNVDIKDMIKTYVRDDMKGYGIEFGHDDTVLLL